MLTRKQHELLTFINQRLAATGVAPSFDEMKDALNLRSKSGIHRLISGLEERGFIRRLQHRARALEVINLPTESAAPTTERGRFSPTVIRGDFAAALPGAPFGIDQRTQIVESISGDQTPCDQLPQSGLDLRL